MKSEKKEKQQRYATITTNKLPELTEAHLHIAASPDRVRFFEEFIQEAEVGRYHWFDSQGFTLQNAGAGVVRCIQLYDHDNCFIALAMIRKTIKLAGGELELAPHTVIMSLDTEQPGDEEAVESLGHTPSSPLPGMEVA